MNVTETPLESLSTPENVALKRERDVSSAEIRLLLKSAVVRFVVAETGKPLRWIPKEERFLFWKSEAIEHLADDEKNRLEDYPGEYFYAASEWCSEVSSDVVVALEKHH